MTYTVPYVDASGLHTPTYQDIEDYLVQSARTIFGQDIYLENDSQDFQDIAARAKTALDLVLALQLAYNARSPVTAIGTALDAVVKLNGIRRNGATYSTTPVDLNGTPFAVISNGVARDVNGVKWNLPSSVTLDSNGEASVTATCQEAGAIIALAGQINIIDTPTFGWTSITNPDASTPGQPEETDAELRARQALSVANPSQALTTGILGGVLAVENVADARLYENDTNLTVNTIDGAYNPDGFPPHSITMVVSGGDGQTIAESIASRKTPGCYTNGDEEFNVVDRYSVVTPIRFFRPEEVEIEVVIYIKALTNYSSAIGDAAVQAVVDRINGLNIGQNIVISELWQAALSVDNNQYPFFSLTLITAGAVGDSQGTADIELNFDQKAITETANITLIVS